MSETPPDRLSVDPDSPFHDAGLLPGPTPLKVLDRIIQDYAA